MLESRPLPTNFRKFLVLTDRFSSTLPIIHSLVDKLLQKELSVVLHTVDQLNFADFSTTRNEVLSLLSSQTMGTFLYIAGSPEMVESLQRLAIEAGFTDSEMEVFRFGDINRMVFCAGCQVIFDVPLVPQVTCQNCGLLLTITDHFSPRLRAYLGYQEIK